MKVPYHGLELIRLQIRKMQIEYQRLSEENRLAQKYISSLSTLDKEQKQLLLVQPRADAIKYLNLSGEMGLLYEFIEKVIQDFTHLEEKG